MNIWNDLLNDSGFRQQLSHRGYSEEIKLTDYIKKYKLEEIMQRSGAITANLLSIDFFSKQAKDLVANNLFLLRTGRGKFVVINKEFFDPPYLNLKFSNCENMKFEIPMGYSNLIKAYT
ncbi:unnamed protein product, partial [marine sediment metagenome]